MTLTEALEPLYRGYLRRLEEMAARLPEGAALTERTTRHDDGRLVLGEHGLPLRFDVADARDGHTYEVHGSHADAPAAEAVRVGRVEVRLTPGNWEELRVACVFDGQPLPEDAAALAELLGGFTVFAWYGGFSGLRPGSLWRGAVHSVKVELRENEVHAIFDLGSAPPAAVEALCHALSGFCQERVPMAYVRIGSG
ncbi:MAG TPA: hypothetical protein VH083_02265 [Myxococcales bacterium]|nr:hypothetical protein [Myxococcales bacterium]